MLTQKYSQSHCQEQTIQSKWLLQWLKKWKKPLGEGAAISHVIIHLKPRFPGWQRTLPSLWAQDPPWATCLTQPHLGVLPAPGPHALGFRGFSSGIRKAICPLLQHWHPGELRLDYQNTTAAGQQTLQHLSLAASCHPNPLFFLNVAEFKFQTNPLSLDPKTWSRTLVLLHLLQVILHPEFNPSACFSHTLPQHLCSEPSTHRALGCSESCQYSHHLKENQENYLRQKKQISCADRMNTFGVWLCQHLSFL